ncbi:mpv17-like protein isoform X1 [Oreochromis aureus]|uniref:mpv17-like protein isoform X1 n=1 Tax=Oreochromis aureus TaxID=47969 RepID=UPI0019536BE6|nr:mpv17-like protein isoform X1 [Oreochromis aureus]
MLKLFLRHARRFPWVTNVTLYGCLFAGGDFVHQWFTGRETIEWRQTRNVAVVAFSFHGNFNFFWMRFLERRFPGNSIGMVMRKLFLDQTTAAPLATSVFYTGVSFLEGKEDILEDWREKFLNTYKTGLMFWPFMQTGDGTAGAALAWMFPHKDDDAEYTKEKVDSEDKVASPSKGTRPCKPTQ